MKNEGSKIGNCKQRGEWAELRFMSRAAEHGLCVSKPWGESSSYDFVVGHEGGLVRVQVKSTSFKLRTGFRCKVCCSHGPYTGDPFDFVAAYIIPENTWFILPAERVLGRQVLTLNSDSEYSKYAPYKEAWQLLRVSGQIKELHGCVEEQPYVREPQVSPIL